MKKRIISIILILLLCLTCLPVSAFAEGDAEALYEQAMEFIDAGDYESAIPLLTEAAALGNAEAQFELGFCYDSGNGVDQSYEKAVEYYRLAADQGNAEAQNNLGVCYENGYGVEKDYEKAVEYYRLSADQCLAIAQYNLGFCYAHGIGVEQDYEKAVEYYRLAADQGDADAQYILGFYYEFGKGVEQNYDEALKYYLLAAEQGDSIAMFGVGDCYFGGKGVEKDWTQAAEWYLKALDAGYEPDEEDEKHIVDVAGKLVEQARAFAEDGDYEAVIPLLMEGASLGYAEAQDDLGLCYAIGLGIEQDYEKAVEYFRLAADQGYADAQFNLGCCYYFGEGVEQDYEKAVEYFRLAVDQGDTYAQTNLGYCYLYGNGVEQDYEEALKYFTLAAGQGDENAMFGIGEYYYYAMSDWTQAAEWYQKAFDAGYVPEEEEEEHVAKVMTARFTDVNETDWYYDSVGYGAGKGIMTGMRADYFGAAEKLSRAQFATVLYRMAGRPEVDYEDVFPDVKENDWFGVPVSWAAENGVVTGYKNGKFGPADDITREQIAVMLYRYAEYMEYDTSEKADLSKYPDAGSVSSWAKDAMEWAVGAGIIQGKDGGKTLAPLGKASRAECAIMVMRFCEKYAV